MLEGTCLASFVSRYKATEVHNTSYFLSRWLDNFQLPNSIVYYLSLVDQIRRFAPLILSASTILLVDKYVPRKRPSVRGMSASLHKRLFSVPAPLAVSTTSISKHSNCLTGVAPSF